MNYNLKCKELQDTLLTAQYLLNASRLVFRSFWSTLAQILREKMIHALTSRDVAYLSSGQ